MSVVRRFHTIREVLYTRPKQTLGAGCALVP